MNWRGVIVVVVLGVVIACAIRFLLGWPQAEFTAQEEAMLEKLPPILDTLVLHEEDLSSLSGDYEVCEGGAGYSVQYKYRSEGGSVEVEDVRRAERSDHPLADSLFCDFGSGAWVSSLVDLPESKEHLLALNRINRSLAEGEEEDLHELADVTSDDLSSEEELLDYRWVDASPLGDTRFAWARTVDNWDMGEQFEIYHFDFHRGVVLAGLLVRLPSSPTAENEALLLAGVFDNKIAAQLELLRPEVQAR
jgi:hypothetical protein